MHFVHIILLNFYIDPPGPNFEGRHFFLEHYAKKSINLRALQKQYLAKKYDGGISRFHFGFWKILKDLAEERKRQASRQSPNLKRLGLKAQSPK